MYISVTNLIKEFKPIEDWESRALKKAKKNLRERSSGKNSKEEIEEEKKVILEEWDRKTKRGIAFQENLCKKDLKNIPNCKYEGYNSSLGDSNELIDSSLAKLEANCTYLEKLLFSNKYKILGYADKIVVKRGTIDIIDNKVIEKIYRTGSFKADNGFVVNSEKMMKPLHHLDICNYNDICLQLSLYMYLAWLNNKVFKIGKLYIRQFIMNDNDKLLDDVLIEVPYMKEEVISILKYKKLNDES